MSITWYPSTASNPPEGIRWPASLQGVCFAILPLDDGTCQGFTEDGYVTPPCADEIEALAYISDWIVTQKGNH
jgi:hypothetical protein